MNIMMYSTRLWHQSWEPCGEYVPSCVNTSCNWHALLHVAIAVWLRLALRDARVTLPPRLALMRVSDGLVGLSTFLAHWIAVS